MHFKYTVSPQTQFQHVSKYIMDLTSTRYHWSISSTVVTHNRVKLADEATLIDDFHVVLSTPAVHLHSHLSNHHFQFNLLNRRQTDTILGRNCCYIICEHICEHMPSRTVYRICVCDQLHVCPPTRPRKCSFVLIKTISPRNAVRVSDIQIQPGALPRSWMAAGGSVTIDHFVQVTVLFEHFELNK